MSARIENLDLKDLWKKEPGLIIIFLYSCGVHRLREGRFGGRTLCFSHQHTASNLVNPEGGSDFTNCIANMKKAPSGTGVR